MKKFIKGNVRLFLGFFIGFLCSSVTVCAAYFYFAPNVSFTPSDTSWEVKNVEEALNDLYEKQKSKGEPVLVGIGDVVYSSGVTTLTNVPFSLANGGSDYVSFQDNVLTIKKAGNYIAVLSIGSHLNRIEGASYSAHIQMQVNNTYVFEANQSYDIHNVNSTILKLKVGDTVVGKYKGDGGGYTKRATYRLFYAG